MDQILWKLVEFNVRLKPSKSYFGMDHIEFSGHVFSKSGYSVMRGSKASGIF